jgi:hypothetical protein
MYALSVGAERWSTMRRLGGPHSRLERQKTTRIRVSARGKTHSGARTTGTTKPTATRDRQRCLLANQLLNHRSDIDVSSKVHSVPKLTLNRGALACSLLPNFAHRSVVLLRMLARSCWLTAQSCCSARSHAPVSSPLRHAAPHAHTLPLVRSVMLLRMLICSRQSHCSRVLTSSRRLSRCCSQTPVRRGNRRPEDD